MPQSHSNIFKIQRISTDQTKGGLHMRNNGFGAIILILALLYILSPIDLIPDVIPVVGWADDLLFGLGAGAAALSASRRY
jgi:hypothetical protein